MDVILDSNIFISDFRMRSPRFLGLFDYLRKTRSMLLIPDVVYEEVIAKYRRDLHERVRALNKSVADVRAKLLSEKPFLLENKKLFQQPDTWVEAQCELLKSRLDTPAKNVHGHRFTNTNEIDLHEVYMRGIGRVPPASEQGEELRDVILWLSILALGKIKKQLTFITSDTGFWDGGEVKPTLRRDIEESGAKILMYRSVEDFIKEHAPAAKEASLEWAAEYKIDLTHDESLFTSLLDEVASVVERRLPNWVVRMLSMKGITLIKGLLYRTGEEQEFAELTYSAVTTGELEKKPEPNASWLDASALYFKPLQPVRRAESFRQFEQKTTIPFEMDAEFVVDAYIESNAVVGLELEVLRGGDVRFPKVEAPSN